MRKLGFAVAVILVVGFLWLLSALRPMDSFSDAKINLYIAPGTSVSAMAAALYEKKLIRSPLAFTLYVREQGSAGSLKAGSYAFSQSQSVADIVASLLEGKSEEVAITIPEGFTVATIDVLLAEKGLGKAGDIIDCANTCTFEAPFLAPKVGSSAAQKARGIGTRLEGYLFPDTYYVSVGNYSPHDFLQRLLTTFESKVITPNRQKMLDSKRSLADIITMASLVEEESRASSDERATVAGILWKRLDTKVLLGVDASIRYSLHKPGSALTRSDLETDSPYNSRVHLGLPPTPIANPGLSAIQAALQPADSDYWYYLHDSDGVIHYAKTNDEHNANRARYLQ